jgi:hypothetical protein
MKLPAHLEVLEGLNVAPINVGYAAGRILRIGAHDFLREARKEYPDSDVFSFDFPLPDRQIVLVASSFDGFRRFNAAENSENPIDRHPGLSGNTSAASDIFAGQGQDRPGILLAKVSPSQRSTNTGLRDRFKLEEVQPDEALARQTAELIVSKSCSGADAHDACQEAVDETLSPAIFGTTSLREHEVFLHEYALELAAVSGLFRSIPHFDKAIRRITKSDSNTRLAELSTVVGNHDLLSSLAGVRGLAKALYWTLYRRSMHLNEELPHVIAETMRYDAAAGFNFPRAMLQEEDPTHIFMVSPVAVLSDDFFGNDPELFNPRRFHEEEGFTRVARIQQFLFGTGRHNCPARAFTPRFIDGVMNELEDRMGTIKLEGSPKLNRAHLVFKTPTRRTQGKFIFV